MRTPIDIVTTHFEKADPSLVPILKQINFDNWFEDSQLDSKALFKSLCRTIVGQQLAGSAAKAIFTRFENLLSNEVTPENILSISPESIRAVGLSWAKVRSVIDLSTKVVNRELLLNSIITLDDDTLISELVKVKGIGKWTAEMILMFKMARADIFSWGDLGLKKGLLKYLHLKGEDPTALEETVNSWRPYRTYGAIAMWHLLDNPK